MKGEESSPSPHSQGSFFWSFFFVYSFGELSGAFDLCPRSEGSERALAAWLVWRVLAGLDNGESGARITFASTLDIHHSHDVKSVLVLLPQWA